MPPVAAKRIGATRPRHRRRRRTPAPGAARPEPVKPDPVAPVEPVSPETLRAHWRIAFDAAQAALRAGRLYLTATELGAHAAELVAERERTSRLLKAYARDHRGGAPVLPGVHTLSQARRMLGLPPEVTACVFSLDGILIGSAAVHAAAWTETFDELISARVERTGGLFAPFNPRIDYRAHIHGKPRLDGVRAFLSSRGISLPEGHPDDAPGTETVHGIANRKNAALLRLLDRQGLTAFAGAHEYLVIARDAGVSRAVVSASANTDTILERAGLSSLIDGSIDGNADRRGAAAPEAGARHPARGLPPARSRAAPHRSVRDEPCRDRRRPHRRLRLRRRRRPLRRGEGCWSTREPTSWSAASTTCSNAGARPERRLRFPAGVMSPSALQLPSAIRACLFDLDGVLTDTATVHARGLEGDVRRVPA